jgi:recombination protein RecT
MPNDMTAPPAERPAAPTNFPAMLKVFQSEIERALPKHMNGDRMARIALTAFRSTPKLAKCEPRSVFAAVIQSAQLGLEVGLMGEAHLVPFGDTCQLIPGYQGLMKLARNSGLISDIYAMDVRENDHFEVTYGMERSLVHDPLKENGFPASDEKRGAITGFYAVAIFKDGAKAFVAMSTKDVEKVRDNSKGYQAAKQYKKASLWDTDFLSMGLKTVIRRLCKYMPKSPELAQAIALDSAFERGAPQNITVKDAIEGTWAPTEEGDAPADAKPAVQMPEETERASAAKEGEVMPKAEGAKKTPSDDKPATAGELKAILKKAGEAGITDVEICKHFGLDTLEAMRASQVRAALDWLKNPAP